MHLSFSLNDKFKVGSYVILVFLVVFFFDGVGLLVADMARYKATRSNKRLRERGFFFFFGPCATPTSCQRLLRIAAF